MYVIAASSLLVGGPNVLAWLILGGLAGTIAGRLLYGRAFGFIGNIILGLIGAWIGGEVANLIFPNGGFRFWGSLVVAVLGSLVTTFIWGSITGKQRRLGKRAA
jgi:uncharacterized membrane protein YeaQ/YmgE (transglycosylase-associated protein family)